MPTSFCSIADAYGSEFGMRSQQRGSSTPPDRSGQAKLNQPQMGSQVGSQMGSQMGSQVGSAQMGSAQMGFQMGGPQQPGPPYECPFCNNCNQRNNVFQQRVIDQAIWPRPRWIPQGVETQGDPYATRYFSDSTPLGVDRSGFASSTRRGAYPSMIEHFTDLQRENFSQQGGENILRLILWLLISLFAIQLVDLVLKLILV